MHTRSFGGWIKQRRKMLDLTQEQLAQQVGCAVITIKKFEADQRRPSVQMAQRLADQLIIPAEERAVFMERARGPLSLQALPPIRSTDPLHAPQPLSLPALPVALTPLIGRLQERAIISSSLLRPAIRLVTLVGPPGVGKTRLGVEVAADLRDHFADGVLLVALASLTDAARVLPTIARQIGLPEEDQDAMLGQMEQRLLGRNVLLVLDNCEHLLAAVPLVTALLARVSTLKVLATSREVLRVYGEQVVRVPPLALPDPALRQPDALLAQSAAVELFTARAQAADHTFTLTEANARTVAAVCIHLDGLPLAIELAAARVGVTSLATLLTRIDQRLTLLTHGPRDLPPRQQTLRATLAWSYELLSSDEQRLFRHLGIFVGDWSAAAVAAVVAETNLDEPVCDGFEVAVAEQLRGLLDKSLVQRVTRPSGDQRFRVLETIREYALAELRQHAETTTVAQRHAQYYLAFARRAQAQLSGAQQQLWLDRLEDDHPNLLAALRWALVRHDHRRGLQLAGALWKFWHLRSHQHEGLQWIGAVLEQHPTQPSRDYAHVLYGAGWLAYDRSEIERAAALFEESYRMFDGLGDTRSVGLVLHGLGELAQVRGAYHDAERVFVQSLGLFRGLKDDEETAWSLDHLGRAVQYQGDAARAVELLQESLALFESMQHSWGRACVLANLGRACAAQGQLERAHSLLRASYDQHTQLGNQRGQAYALALLGEVAWRQGELAEASGYFSASQGISQPLEDQWCEALALEGLGRVATEAGSYDHARAYLTEALRLWQAIDGHPGRLTQTLESVVVLAIAEGRMDQALRLGGAITVIQRSLGLVAMPFDRLVYEQALARAHQILGDASRQLCQAGSALSIGQAIALAATLVAGDG